MATRRQQNRRVREIFTAVNIPSPVAIKLWVVLLVLRACSCLWSVASNSKGHFRLRSNRSKIGYMLAKQALYSRDA